MRTLALLLGLLAAPPGRANKTTEIVTLHMDAYHGSTAAELVLMSSDNVTTLCSMGCWQCEARFENTTSKCTNARRDTFARALSDWSVYWNLTRPVLLLKYGNSQDPRKLVKQTGSQDFIAKASLHLPRRMLDAGVTSLRLNILQVWRPLCLSKLSSHFTGTVEKKIGKQRALEGEARVIERQARDHRAFRAAGVNVLLLSYADLLWRPDVVLQRLRSFLPGGLLQGVRLDFEPKLGRDFFPGNGFKVHGTLASYGKAHPPDSLDYDPKRSICKSTASTDVLNVSYFEAERYLLCWSA